ncbi:hypothetical protein GCM10007981_01020 [Thermocladium modestius]|uniref:DUF7982 domain-containing protein n=1 Tax=Thermocladium modestius TaxID=62609 RepID=A0A830GQU1_9CREN|nr:hypothetical protein [Thermocladium modestius]GGP19021.1 hypothetical protein GCM10007981_01020 [Thermocladium modestius]
MSGDLGPSLAVVGVGLAVIGLLITRSIPLTILGASVAVMGVLAGWGEGAVEESLLGLSSASWDDLALLLEAVGAVGRAVYIPSALTEDSRPCALIPQGGEGVWGGFSGKLPAGFVVRYGPGPSGIGLRLATMGSKAVEACMEAGAVSGDLGSTLSNCLVNHLSLARRVEASSQGDSVTVVVWGSRAGAVYGGTVVEAVLGSPTASMVAALAAEALGRPVEVAGEEKERGDAARRGGGALRVSLRVV